MINFAQNAKLFLCETSIAASQPTTFCATAFLNLLGLALRFLARNTKLE